MRTWLYAVVFSALVILPFSAAQAQQGQRIALLVGNKAYSKAVGSLDNPHKDIELLARTLRGLGFRVMPLVKDAGRNAILGAIYDYTQALDRAGPKATGFFYYSGHGLAVGRANYIVPVDVPDLKVRSIRAGGLPLDRVTSDLKTQASGADHFVVFDACRNVRGIKGQKGFVPVQQRNGMLIAFSTAPGKTASDGNPGDPAGPYARILAEELKQPGQHEGNIFYNVRTRVAALGEDQIPRQMNGLLKRHFFAPRMSKHKIVRIQKLLQELKYDPGTADGLTGEKTRKAIRQFQTAYWGAGLATGEVSENLLISLQTAVNGQRRFASMTPRPQTPKPQQTLVQPAIGVFREPVQPRRRKRKSYEPETVFIPGGTFSMGCVSGKGCRDNEKPVHRVTVSGFHMSKYETTVGEYMACVKARACKSPEWQEKGSNYNIRTGSDNYYKKLGNALTGKRHPIVGVSWNNAVAYAKWLSRKTGDVWRLPTEAEWEYAARGDRSGGNKTKYSWGNNIGKNRANCGSECKDKWQYTAPVGKFSANKFGLYDMHGNVWEWVSDWYGEDYYKHSLASNPKGPKSGRYRVSRGGSWNYDAGRLRSALRNRFLPDNRNDFLGFRLMRQPS